MSVGLTRARGARGFEGDPAGANPSVGGHEHQRVPPLGESFRPRIVRDRVGSRTVRRRAGSVGDHGDAVPVGGWRHRCIKSALSAAMIERSWAPPAHLGRSSTSTTRSCGQLLARVTSGAITSGLTRIAMSGWNCTVVPVVPSSATVVRSVVGTPCSYRRRGPRA